MKEIPLSRGKVAIVDDEDYERVNQFRWYAITTHGCWYARRDYVIGGKRLFYTLHRFILDAPNGVPVDHIDRNGLNCVKSNMRLCSPADNQRNRRKPSTNTSGYKGVSWISGKWNAYIEVDYKSIYLGRFASKEDAARAYDAAARKYHGEFAYQNFP